MGCYEPRPVWTSRTTTHSQPSTLNPKPSTLNSQPSTLNPKLFFAAGAGQTILIFKYEEDSGFKVCLKSLKTRDSFCLHILIITIRGSQYFEKIQLRAHTCAQAGACKHTRVRRCGSASAVPQPNQICCVSQLFRAFAYKERAAPASE